MSVKRNIGRAITSGLEAARDAWQQQREFSLQQAMQDIREGQLGLQRKQFGLDEQEFGLAERLSTSEIAHRDAQAKYFDAQAQEIRDKQKLLDFIKKGEGGFFGQGGGRSDAELRAIESWAAGGGRGPLFMHERGEPTQTPSAYSPNQLEIIRGALEQSRPDFKGAVTQDQAHQIMESASPDDIYQVGNTSPYGPRRPGYENLREYVGDPEIPATTVPGQNILRQINLGVPPDANLRAALDAYGFNPTGILGAVGSGLQEQSLRGQLESAQQLQQESQEWNQRVGQGQVPQAQVGYTDENGDQQMWVGPQWLLNQYSQAGRVPWDDAPDGSGRIGGGIVVQPPLSATAQQRLADSEIIAQQMALIMNPLDELIGDYLSGATDELPIGPVAGRIASWKADLGLETNNDFNDLRILIAGTANQIINNLSGAAVSPSELVRLELQLPSVRDPIDILLAKLKMVEETANIAIQSFKSGSTYAEQLVINPGLGDYARRVEDWRSRLETHGAGNETTGPGGVMDESNRNYVSPENLPF